MVRSPALTALTRFGLGPRPDEIAALSDPRGAVLAQCEDPAQALIVAPDLGGSDRQAGRFLALQRAIDEAAAAGRDVAPAAQPVAAEARAVIRAETHARVQHAVATRHPFVERLVLFWSNHFAVNWHHAAALGFLTGSFEREAIRPHVLGRFETMLAAATTHPAMLIYLDNAGNVGPNSRAGRRRGGPPLTENLARELLELHTLGADGGYTQADVVALAGTLSGWTGGVLQRPPRFADIHEPGPRTILGASYPGAGAEELGGVLARLARHPATARHLAGKFARHFVGAGAAPSLIAALEESFRTTGGDLAALARTLLAHDAAWDAPPTKLVPPYDMIVVCARALGVEALPAPFHIRAANVLGQAAWTPPSPAGWPDDDAAFLGGASVLERIDVANRMALRFGTGLRPGALAGRLFGAAVDPALATALARAADPVQGLTLLLMSPALQRR